MGRDEQSRKFVSKVAVYILLNFGEIYWRGEWEGKGVGEGSC